MALIRVWCSDLVRRCFGCSVHLRSGFDDGGDSMVSKTRVHLPRVLRARVLAARRQFRNCQSHPWFLRTAHQRTFERIASRRTIRPLACCSQTRGCMCSFPVAGWVCLCGRVREFAGSSTRVNQPVVMFCRYWSCCCRIESTVSRSMLDACVDLATECQRRCRAAATPTFDRSCGIRRSSIVDASVDRFAQYLRSIHSVLV